MADLLPALLPRLAACCPPGARVLVAVSGGPDSQALLDLLARARRGLRLGTLAAAGVDHGLRAAAGTELAHARRLAAAHGLAYQRLEVAVARHGNRLQAARRARYAALRALARARGYDRIALGHHADDQAETVLFHLTRGCGLRGAGAMRPRRGPLVRPLLEVSRAALAAYVAWRGLTAAHDPSNDDPRRSRTRLRQTVLPALSQLNVRSTLHLAAFAAAARDDDAYLTRRAARLVTRRTGPGGELPCAAVRRLPRALATRVLQAWLRGRGLRAGRPLLQAVLTRCRAAATAPAAAWSLAGHTLRVARDAAWLEAPAAAYEMTLPTAGSVALPGDGRLLRCSAGAPAAAGETWTRGAQTVAFDADRLHFALAVRPWRAGDRLRPFGGAGHITVGDLFTNAKVPRALRPSWPVVVHGREIAWVVGLRRGEVAPVTAATCRVVRLKVEAACPAGHA